jgi:8-oxo-dGTP diphosphatase
MQKEFEILVRAVIVSNGEILLCRSKARGYYFFPGGHVEFGERVEDVLKRELNEEIGIEPKSFRFIGFVENIFEEDGKSHHEVDLFFSAEVDKDKLCFGEDHIEFEWKPIENVSNIDVRPRVARDKVVDWVKYGKEFSANK